MATVLVPSLQCVHVYVTPSFSFNTNDLLQNVFGSETCNRILFDETATNE